MKKLTIEELRISGKIAKDQKGYVFVVLENGNLKTKVENVNTSYEIDFDYLAVLTPDGIFNTDYVLYNGYETSIKNFVQLINEENEKGLLIA